MTKKKAKWLIRKWRNEPCRVVFTNGCFDILHLGHVDYLEKSRYLGDKLIVALNSDNSVKRLKGENRPVNNFFARSRVVAALAFVDVVIKFEEETPLDTITYLKPDVLVKGKDYMKSDIVGAEVVEQAGGTVETIDLTEGFSTTQLIEKLKRQ